ncbi:MAG: hypothetical protein ACOCQ4_00895, partial [bacterium]
MSAQIATENLQLWLCADSLEVDEGSVDSWYDLSGNNFHLSQTNLNSQPTFTDSVINNQPTVYFDGIDDFMSVDFATNFSQPITIFVVWNSLNNQHNMIYDNYSGTRFFLFRANDGELRINAENANLAYDIGFQTKFLLTTSIYNFNNSVIKENSLIKNTGNVSNGMLNGINLGRYSQGVHFLNGNIAELIVYNDILSESDQVIIENYLMNKYTPSFELGDDISLEYNLCDTILIIPPNVSNNFSNFLWSTGDTTDTINISNPGTYILSGTDIFNRTHYDTIEITYPGEISEDFLYCLGDSVFVDPQLSATDYTFTWSTGSNDSAIYISEVGDYWVEITDTNACSKIYDFSLIVDSFPEEIILPSDTSICSGNSLSLSENNADIVSYEWGPNGETDSLIYISEAGEYTVQCINVNGCSAFDTVQVNIQGVAPTPDFSVSNLCFGDTTYFTDLSQHPDSIASWLWIFNETDSVYEQNPGHVFQSVGAQDVKLVLESFSGCVKDTSFTIDVLAVPEVSFTNHPVCSGVEVMFEPEITIPNGISITGQNWYVNDTLISASETLLYTFTNIGDNMVSLEVILENGCSEWYSSLIEVNNSYPVAENISLVSPSNGMITDSSEINFAWNTDVNAAYYQLILATDENFQDTLLASDLLTVNEYQHTFITEYDSVYWKVIAFNPCLSPAASDVFSFNNFTPDHLPSLQLWLSADSVNLVSDAVETWHDLSGNNHHVSQFDVIHQPQKVNSVLNNQPVIRFDGNNDFLMVDFEQEFVQPASIFVLWNCYDNSNNMIYDNITNSRFFLFRNNSGELRINAENVNLGYYLPDYDSYKITTGVYNYSNSSVYENGILKNTGDVGNGTLSGLNFGRFSANIHHFNGDIAEFIFYNDLLSDEEITTVQQYLKNKYFNAPPVNLSYDIRVPYGFCDTTITTA